MGLSQEEMAWRAGLHRTHLANIERGGRNLTLNSIANLAFALRVTPGFLLNAGGDLPANSSGIQESNTILMIEDSEEDAELAIKGLRRARLANPLKHVWDGTEALSYLNCTGRYAKRQPELPQLVLLDLVLPDIPGQEILRAIKSDVRLRHIPVVVLTSSRSERAFAQCKQLGAEDYITKPLSFDGLCKITQKIDLQWSLSPVESFSGKK